MNFLEKLDKLLFEKGLNKNSFSKQSGIPYTTVDGWYKKGYEDMRLSTLKKLSNFFKTDLDFWVKEDIDITYHNDGGVIMGIYRNNVSFNIAKYRKEIGMTQGELAEKLNVRPTTVSGWERGANSPDIDTLVEICKIFKITLSTVLGFDDSIRKITPTEDKLLTIFNSFNKEGQEKLLSIADDMYASKKYESTEQRNNFQTQNKLN